MALSGPLRSPVRPTAKINVKGGIPKKDKQAPAHFRLESSVVVLDKRGKPEYNNNCYSIMR